MLRITPAGRRVVGLLLLPALLLSPLAVLPAAALDPSAYADPAIQRTWERTDKPVEDGAVARTWVWGMPVTGALEEPYVESPDASRLVQYFDKSRMEITDPNGDQSSIWYVTNGLLVVELMSGLRQEGNNGFAVAGRANVNVAGDPLDADAVTYADLAPLITAPPAADGATITQRIDGEGQVTEDASLASFGVTAAQRLSVPGLDHQIASVFWDYMHSTGLIWENGAFATANLFPDPYYATGYPLTEPYWTNVDVGGADTLVLLQCFERRCLTYTPTNAPEWRVEMGNVGLHYHAWRYTPTADPGETLFIGFLDPLDSGAAAAPRRDPNASPAPKGSVTLVRTPGAADDYTIVLDMESAGEITNFQIRFRPPYPRGEHVMLERNVPDGTSNLGEMTTTIDLDELSDGKELGNITAGQFSEMVKNGDITFYVRTTQNPNGFEGKLSQPVEMVFNANLIPNAGGPIFGSVSTYVNLSDNTVEYSTMAYVPQPDEAFASWQDADGDERTIPLVTPIPGVPTGGFIAATSLAPSSVPQFTQQLFSGNVEYTVTSATFPDIEFSGSTTVLHPNFQPSLWFFVMNGDSVVPAVDTPGRGTGVLTWDSVDDMNLLVTSADLAGITGVNFYSGPREQNGDSLFELPVDFQPGETNGVVGQWQIHPALVGYSLMRFAYLVSSQQVYMTLPTDEHLAGAIRGQGQYPAGLQPYGLYLAELTDEALDASITVMLFHSGNQATYSGEAITWDMYCDGVIEWEDAVIVSELLGLELAHLIPNEPSDRENGDGFCGSGGITLEDVGVGEPWRGSFEDWPPDGWTPAGRAFIQALVTLNVLFGDIRPLWVNQRALD